MPIARFQMPDGRVARFEVPEGTSPEQAQTMMEAHFAPQATAAPYSDARQGPPVQPDRTFPQQLGQMVMNIPGSAANFAGGIAHAVAHPIDTASGMWDAAAGGLRNAMPASVRGAIDKADWNPAAAQRATDTADAVGRVYKQRYGGLSNIGDTIISDPVGALADVSTIFTGGAALPGKVGAALSAGAKYTNPLSPLGALGAVKPATDSVSASLMQSALKPTIKQLQTGDAATTVQTLLDKGINPTKAGTEKLRGLIGAKNDEIAGLLAGSNARIAKSDVLTGLDPVRAKFTNQVDPIADLGSIQRVADGFDMHPGIPGGDMPIQQAQSMKQGTYKVLNGKYGQLGSAETEAQKGLARGLKDQIAAAVPEVATANAEESKLLTTLKVTERRALMDLNKNPMGLAMLAHSPMAWAAFMADKSAAFKSMAARLVYSTGNGFDAASNAAGNVGVTAPRVAAGGLLSEQLGNADEMQSKRRGLLAQ